MEKRMFNTNPPVKVGDEVDVTIEAVGEKGDGVAKKDGFVLFVPGAKEGQNARIRVTRVLTKVGFAEIIGEAQGVPSSERTPAADSHNSTQQTEHQSNDYSQNNSDSSQDAHIDTEDFGEESEEDAKE